MPGEAGMGNSEGKKSLSETLMKGDQILLNDKGNL
jgi:hypothetical protein